MPSPSTGSVVKKTQQPIPKVGPYNARFSAVVDLGTHMSKGQFAKEQFEVVLQLELVDTNYDFDKHRPADKKRNKGPEPFVITKRFNKMMGNKANLHKFIAAARGRAFEDGEAEKFNLFSIIGKPTQVNISHRADKLQPEIKYAEIMGLPMPPINPKEVKKLRNPTFAFNIMDLSNPEYKEEALATFGKLYSWMQSEITSSPEYKAAMDGGSSGASSFDNPDDPYAEAEGASEEENDTF